MAAAGWDPSLSTREEVQSVDKIDERLTKPIGSLLGCQRKGSDKWL